MSTSSADRPAVPIDPNEAEYHSLLIGRGSLSTKITLGLRNCACIGTFRVWVEFLVVLVSVVFYIIFTDMTKVPAYIFHVQQAVGFLFLVDYVINICSAPTWFGYILSVKGGIDLLSIIPSGFYWSHPAGVYPALIQILLFFRVLRMIPLLRSLGLSGLSIEQHIFTLIIHVIGLVFIAAGIMHWVDYIATTTQYKKLHSCNPKGCITFLESLYFMVVTISTVGYGDITPHSSWGRLVAVFAIVGAIIYFPLKVNALFELASKRPFGAGVCQKLSTIVGPRFVVVSGNLTVKIVQKFTAEFFHPSRHADITRDPFHVVILAPFRPSFELSRVLAPYNGRVNFIEGNPLRDVDLYRVGAKMASAFFLVANHNAEDFDAEDAMQILSALSVKKHTSAKMRVIVELLRPENQSQSIWDGFENIDKICPEDIRFKLLFTSCSIRGLSTFVTNLFCYGGPPLTHKEDSIWMQEYKAGLRQKVYHVLLPRCFHENRLLFQKVAEVIHQKHRVILFGLNIIKGNEGDREIAIFPMGHTILPTDIGICIAGSFHHAQKVSGMVYKNTEAIADIEAAGEDEQQERNDPVETLHQRMMIKMRWPESSSKFRPDPYTLWLKENQILLHLKSHTLSTVTFEESHILVCVEGKWPINFYYFFTLESSSGSRPIVILHPNKPTVAEWSCVRMQQNVYFIQGSPLYELDLFHSGVMKADKILVIESEDTAQYPKSVFIAATLRNFLKDAPKKPLIIEVHDEQAMNYLEPNWLQNSHSTFQNCPTYIDGSAFSHESLLFLMC